MNDGSLVSVAMAAYNVELFIEQALESIKKQTYKNWEVIIVLDGCTDNTLGAIKRFIESSPSVSKKIKVFSHKLNYGYGASLRNAIEKGTGELVAVVDADDALAEPKAFEILVEEHCKHPEASLIYSDYYECNSELKNPNRKNCSTIPSGKTFLGDFRGGKYIGTNYMISHLKMFKRSFYDLTDGVDHTLLKAVDKDLCLRLEEVGELIHISVPLYYHRNHVNSITGLYKHRNTNYKGVILEGKKRMYFGALERRKKGVFKTQ
jgi:glycosyltransferase involved in cell wall biosynthesis